MYSNDDYHRREQERRDQERRQADEQRRLDDQRRYEERQRDEQRRRAEEEGYWRRKEEEQRHQLNREKQTREEILNDVSKSKQEREAELQRHQQEWDDQRKKQHDQENQASTPPPRAQASSATPSIAASPSAFTHPWDDDFVGLFRFALGITVIFAPPFLAYTALRLLVVKFPGYASDPSFAGAVASAFVEAFGVVGLQLKQLYWALSGGLGWPIFWFSVAVWVVMLLLAWVPYALFHVRRTLGLAAGAVMLTPVGLLAYVAVHFWR